MAGRDEGEFELILGNRQLLSVLFIIILLLGVFFAMGFLAGRSTGSGQVAKSSRPESEAKPIEIDSAKPAGAPRQAAAADETPKAEPARQPEAEQPKAEPAKEAPGPAAKEPAPATAAPARSARAEAGAYTENPPAGTYLQAAATRRPDADNMVRLIGQEGLPGFVTPSPKSPDLFRVIFGPLKTNEDVARARDVLAKHGIKQPYIVKY